MKKPPYQSNQDQPAELDKVLHDLAAHPLQNYVLQELETSLKQVKQLEQRGVELSIEDVGRLSTYFFESGDGYYVGIESNLPSTYYEVYPSYLQDNEKYLSKLSSKERRQTRRVLIAQNGSDLRTDALLHPQLYKDFIEWHVRNGVGLYWIEANKAERIRATFNLPTTDVAFWNDSHGVTFKPHPTSHSVHIKLVRKGIPDFVTLAKYTQAVLENASLLTIETDKLPVMSEELVQRWEGYAGTRAFREQGIGQLLARELDVNEGWSYGRVLDVAAGSGYEARFLASKGYDVTANELDPLWNQLLNKRLTEAGLPVEIYQYDWRVLSQHLKPLYTAIVAVGNSLSMAIGKAERKRSIQEFYDVLRPGGKLIIDERNFPLIQSKLSHGEPCFAKSALYNCETVSGKLTIEDETNNLIRFTLADVATGRKLGAIIVQALPKGELKKLIQAAGFKDIKMYSDLVPGENPTAQIYTYVATK